MNEIVRAKLTAIEVEQKLEYIRSQYERHLALHKIKTNTGTLESIVVTGSEILEDLVHFKFSKVAKAMFSLKHRRIEMLEAELTSAGSEVAYIIKAKEQFS
ncbi:MAG: hypothetical protein ABR555_19550 [Pyrinomonadaceae bacterium]